MRVTLALPAAVVILSGCIGVGTMRELAPDVGTHVRYAAPVSAVRHALPGAIEQRGLRIELEESVDSVTTMVIARKGAGFFSNGVMVRVLVWPAADGAQTSARVVARSRYALDLSGAADRWEPRTIAALDAALDPQTIGPFPGMEVRGRTGDRNDAPLRGRVVAAADGTLLFRPLTPEGDALTPLAALRDLAVLRGSYSHRSEGAVVGSLGGLLLGAVIGAATSDGVDRRTAMSWGMSIGMASGALAGMLVGGAIRTEVWSAAGAPR